MGHAFLQVERSLRGRRWVGPDTQTLRCAEAIAQVTVLTPSLAAVLGRLRVAPAEAERYLKPQLRDLLPDPSGIKDLPLAAERLLKAVHRQERIAIFADYDVDGGASAALLLWWLRAFGINATLYIPDRIDEGYGPNVPAMRALAEEHDLIICVDCGTLSHEPIAAVTGADVLVIDHHLGGETLPPALAVVNPNRQDETGELSHLCAAGVVFLVLVQVGTLLRHAGKPGPNLLNLLDLVALATVADVAPLIGVNRAFVQQGLKVMARRARPGLVALTDQASITSAPTAYHLGYVLGPRINAGGRIGQADLGARLLASENAAEAKAMAERLEALNAERREIENQVRIAAMAQAEARGLDAPLTWAADEGWHPGVVGIVAARLKEATNRPAIVIGLEGAEGKGSGRSVPGVDLGAAIQRLAQEGLLIKGGGHKMAAGLTVARDSLEPAMNRLSELLAAQGAGQMGAKELRIDSLLAPAAATPELIEGLEAAGPFGASAPAPRFVLPHMRINFIKRLGDKHLKLRVASSLGGKQSLEIIAFGAFDTEIGPALLAGQDALWHFAGQLELNSWGGRNSVQMRLEDAAPETA